MQNVKRIRQSTAAILSVYIYTTSWLCGYSQTFHTISVSSHGLFHLGRLLIYFPFFRLSFSFPFFSFSPEGKKGKKGGCLERGKKEGVGRVFFFFFRSFLFFLPKERKERKGGVWRERRACLEGEKVRWESTQSCWMQG